jgi:hypothetical protein
MSEEKEKKIPRLKADSSSTNEKKEKKKTSSAASGISVFFNFPLFFLFFSSYSTQRCVCLFVRCLNKEEDPIERSRYECRI